MLFFIIRNAVIVSLFQIEGNVHGASDMPATCRKLEPAVANE